MRLPRVFVALTPRRDGVWPHRSHVEIPMTEIRTFRAALPSALADVELRDEGVAQRRGLRGLVGVGGQEVAVDVVRVVGQLCGARGEGKQRARMEVAEVGVATGLQEQMRIGETMVQLQRLRGAVMSVRVSDDGEQCGADQQGRRAQERGRDTHDEKGVRELHTEWSETQSVSVVPNPLIRPFSTAEAAARLMGIHQAASHMDLQCFWRRRAVTCRRSECPTD